MATFRQRWGAGGEGDLDQAPGPQTPQSCSFLLCNGISTERVWAVLQHRRAARRR